MTKQILKEIEELFYLKLEKQTNWGRNQIKEIYSQCVIEVLSNHIP